MGKRKGAGKALGQSAKESARERPSKLKINGYEDVADSQDEFHLNREKILLEEGSVDKARRKQREQDEFLEQDEVLAYEDEDEAHSDDFDDDEQEDAELSDDNEVLKDRKGRKAVEDEEEEGWGNSKSDYYNADAIETEQDALDEEAEALRIQKKQLQSMTEADYGFDESEWLGEAKETEADGAEAEEVVTEVLPQLQISEDMSTEERLKILRSRYPEFESLAQEFRELQPLHDGLSVAATYSEKINRKRNTANGILRPSKATIKFQALSAYLSSIAMYFALLTSTFSEEKGVVTAKAPQELRNHSVIDTLVQCRALWNRVKDMELLDGVDDKSEDDDDQAITGSQEPAPEVQPIDVHPSAATTRPKIKKTKAQRAAEKALAAAEMKAAERKRKTEEDLAALSTLTSAPTKRQKLTTTAPTNGRASDDSDLGEETELTAEALAEKARRRKSLKFYTSQIVQKSNKRSGAARDLGGDMDVPHRERWRDRQARLNAEAEKRGKSKKLEQGEELGGESDEEGRRQAKDIRNEAVEDGGGGDDDDDYYDMVASRSKKRKLEKAEKANAYAQAAREGGQVIEEESIGPDGKRAIGYTISKNKGLAPKRGKNVISRVKKRQRYEGAKKKLKSMKAVYSGGEGRGGYGGELTGIKKGLVKSVKL